MLLELIIVLFLMSVILGLSAIFFANSLPGYRLNATVRNISTTIKQARSFAKMLNEQQIVTIDLENRQYVLKVIIPRTSHRIFLLKSSILSQGK